MQSGRQKRSAILAPLYLSPLLLGSLLLSALLLGAAFPAASAAAGAESRYPLTFTDDLGRPVTLPEEPRRIVSIGPSITEILFAVGAGEQVVGVDRFSNYPPEAAAVASVGSLTAPSYDTVVSLQPDLVFLSISSESEVVAALEALGLRTAVLAPERLDAVVDAILRVGVITNRQGEAEALAAGIRARIEAVRAATASIPREQRVRVFYELWHDPLRSAGPGTYIHDLIEAAGGVNIAGDAPAPWPHFSHEALVARDPQVIITADAGSFNEIVAGRRAQWNGVSAVRERRVHLLDRDVLNRPGPRVVQALEEIARALYPDRFRD